MTHLGSINGTGRILIGDKDIGEVEYEIDVYKPRFLMEARGQLEGLDSTLFQALGAKGVVLKLESGEPISIIVNQHSLGSGYASIVVNGPIPGFQA